MEENFGLTWEDSTTVVQTEEVICGIENEILPGESEEFTGVEDGNVVEEEVIGEDHHDEEDVVDNHSGASVLYLPDGNLVVVHGQSQHYNPHDDPDLVECQVTTEEMITDQWTEGCAEEIVVGSEQAVGAEEVANDECEVPLPTCQDEYTAARPYPCDFCSRRFRKKTNLMSHMVAHQTDRPHGCNLCGVRYIRKCDLMNHLKIHAYIPEPDGMDEEEAQNLEEFEEEKTKKKKQTRRKKKTVKVKDEYDSFEADDMGIEGASTSRNYSYVQEDVKMLEQMPIGEERSPAYDNLQEEQPEEERYPILDPRKPFVCQHCGVGFAREKAFLSHTRLHAEGDSPFECQKCGDMFWDHNLMREHAKEKHGDVEDFYDDEDEDYSEEETKFGTFYCSTCGLSFHRQDNLRRHQRVHVKEEYVNEHEFGHVCSVCGESFEEALALLAHAELHARNVDMYRCMICGDILQDENSLAVHVQTKHGKTLPPNTCMLCGKTCKDRRTLLKHSWDHSKEKLFACSKCAKTFHNKARLKRHMLSHRSKVVSCDVCNEEFPDGRSLMNHRHSHSSVSGRQFPCWECGKTFGSRSSQQIHIRIHTGERPYGCRFCWKAFADGGTLRKHERIHTGEKPYACAVCPRAFNQRVVLREHIRSHHSAPDPKYSNSMTPYCCSVCSDMFTTSQDLILHLIHHCDMNTAMKRQPQIGPRKYKRRRKLKPHELELISSQNEDDVNHLEAPLNNTFSDSEDDRQRRRRYTRKQSKKAASSPEEPTIDPFIEQYNSTLSAVESITSPSIPATKTSPAKGKAKKSKNDSMPSRPKMIHTQKTRVPVEANEDGRVRHKTRTLITRTQPAEIKSSTGERIRPRTKNVSYHVLQPEKLPVATFPIDEQLEEQQIDANQQAVDALLKDENIAAHEIIDDHMQINGTAFDEPPEIASEQTVETEDMDTIGEEKRTRTRSSSGGSLKSARNVIGPGSKVRLIKEGMIVSKAKTPRKSEEAETEPVLPEPEITPPEEDLLVIKEEIISHTELPVKQEVVDPSPLHELAEISMQHAQTQNLFKCEMCSEVFSDRAQLLVHVPIHI